MISLANITYEIRTVTKVLGILIAVGLLLYLGFQGVQLISRIINPPTAPPPEMKFGLLKDFTFPDSNTTPKSYTIDTKTGKLPVFPDRVRIYKITAENPRLPGLVDARSRARTLKYTEQETKVASIPNVYSWKDEYGNTLSYNIVTFNFDITANPTSPTLQSVPGSLPSTSHVKNVATNILSRLGNPTEELEVLDSNFTYYQNSGTALSPVDNNNIASAVRVYFTYTPLDVTPFQFIEETISAIPVVHPVADITMLSNMYITYVSTPLDIVIMQAKFRYQSIDREEYSEYYIKDVASAYEELQSGKSYVISSGASNNNAITDVTLGYYIGDQPQEYTYPVYIFKGKDFTAYVNALDERSIMK